MEEMGETIVYDMHHWECPYCGAGHQQEEEPSETTICEDCGKEFRLVS